MDAFVTFFSEHAPVSHWYLFLAALLAGCYLPISIDALVIIAAVLAAQFVPERLWFLYGSILAGCHLSAWIPYFVGKTFGLKWQNKPFFRSFLSEEKVSSMKKFYLKYGIWAFIGGRFIPFGVRNALFLTAGVSKMPFRRFLVFDAVACFIWVSLSFTLFFRLGRTFDAVWGSLKKFNLYLFPVFAVAVMSVFWYKRAHTIRSKKSNISS